MCYRSEHCHYVWPVFATVIGKSPKGFLVCKMIFVLGVQDCDLAQVAILQGLISQSKLHISKIFALRPLVCQLFKPINREYSILSVCRWWTILMQRRAVGVARHSPQDEQ